MGKLIDSAPLLKVAWHGSMADGSVSERENKPYHHSTKWPDLRPSH